MRGNNSGIVSCDIRAAIANSIIAGKCGRAERSGVFAKSSARIEPLPQWTLDRKAPFIHAQEKSTALQWIRSDLQVSHSTTYPGLHFPTWSCRRTSAAVLVAIASITAFIAAVTRITARITAGIAVRSTVTVLLTLV